MAALTAIELGEESDDANVGILTHKLLELYYENRVDTVSLVYEPGNDDPDWLEAQRLFGGYRKRYPANEWEVKGAEIPISVTNIDTFGVPELTGRLDLLVKLSAAHCEILKETRKLDLTPGLYIVDTKTKKQRRASLELEFQESIQFHAYMAMAEARGFPVQGLIANVLVRHLELDTGRNAGRSFFSSLIKPPSDYHKEFVRATLARCYQLRERLGIYNNPERCFDYGRVCPHLISGECDRL